MRFVKVNNNNNNNYNKNNNNNNNNNNIILIIIIIIIIIITTDLISVNVFSTRGLIGDIFQARIGSWKSRFLRRG